MDKGDWIKVGIAVARKWPLDERVQIQEIERGVHRYSVAVMPSVPVCEWGVSLPESADFDLERIDVEKLVLRPGVSVHLGYGERSRVLVFWEGESL
jgi:hypothetical protein